MKKDSLKEILMSILVFAFCIFGFVFSSVAAQGIISTVAGTGKCGFSGDGEKATQAKLDTPTSVFVDSEDNLFIADKRNHLIRSVDGQTGIITTVVGTAGERGFSGDGGKVTQAKLNNPKGIFVDSEGNLFIADSGNARIRRVDGQTGIITTVAGTKEAGFSGDGGKATEARLNCPTGILVDSEGNLFILDRRNNCIRRVDAQTRIITTVVGTGERGFFGDGGKATQAGLNWPSGFFMDSEGNLFTADEYNHRIRRIDSQTGIITTVVGTEEAGFSGDGGKATQARLGNPTSVFVDSENNLFIADSDNVRIRRVDSQTGIITTVVGAGGAGFSGDGEEATQASLNWPTGIFVDSKGNLFIADLYNHCIRFVENIAVPTTLAVGVFTPIIESPKLPAWDVNQDGTIDISDLVLVGRHIGETGEGIIGDINGDGTVDISDLVLVGIHFGESIE